MPACRLAVWGDWPGAEVLAGDSTPSAGGVAPGKVQDVEDVPGQEGLVFVLGATDPQGLSLQGGVGPIHRRLFRRG